MLLRCCTTDFLSAESDVSGGIIQGLVFDDNSGGEIIEEVVSGTAGSQDTQKFIGLLHPHPSDHSYPALKQRFRHQACRGPDHGDFGMRSGHLQNFIQRVVQQGDTGYDQYVGFGDDFPGTLRGYEVGHFFWPEGGWVLRDDPPGAAQGNPKEYSDIDLAVISDWFEGKPKIENMQYLSIPILPSIAFFASTFPSGTKALFPMWAIYKY